MTNPAGSQASLVIGQSVDGLWGDDSCHVDKALKAPVRRSTRRLQCEARVTDCLSYSNLRGSQYIPKDSCSYLFCYPVALAAACGLSVAPPVPSSFCPWVARVRCCRRPSDGSRGSNATLRLWCVTPSTALWSPNSYAMNLISARPLFLSLPGAIRRLRSRSPHCMFIARHLRRYCWYCRRIIM